MIEPLGDTPVPFHQLLVASGDDGVRGLPSGRLRGSTRLVTTAEYRWLIAPSLDASLFFDWGGAFDRRFEGFTIDRMRPSVGVGLRAFSGLDRSWLRRLAGGLELAWAPGDGVRLLLSIEP
jgi:outer membrane protein assembly factor BamA